MARFVKSATVESAGRCRTTVEIILWVCRAIVLMFAVMDRVLWIAWLPGVNGDEAWFGVQMGRLLDGQSIRFSTPSHLPMNPLHVVPEAILLAFNSPSFWILRAPALFSGLLLLPVSYILLSRAEGRTIALAATILLAVNPTLIAYSRFGWDPSHTPLVSLVALHFAIRGRTLGLVLALLAAIWVHATNVFLAPVLLPAWLWARTPSRWKELGVGGALAAYSADNRLVLVSGGIIAGVGCLAMLIARSEQILELLKVRSGPYQWISLIKSVLDLLSGVSVFATIAGPMPTWFRFTSRFALATLAAAGTINLVRQKYWSRLTLATGMIFGCLIFGLVGGPHRIGVPHERYGMFLVVPGVLLLVYNLQSILPSPRDPVPVSVAFPVPLIAFTLLISVVCLSSFQRFYIRVFLTTGGEAHRAFRTAETEPKLQVVQLLLEEIGKGMHRSTGAGVYLRRIIAEDWWLEQPLRFLLLRSKELVVIGLKELGTSQEERETRLREELEQGSYAVGFVQGTVEQVSRESFSRPSLTIWDIHDRGGRNLMRVFHVDDVERPSEAEHSTGHD